MGRRKKAKPQPNRYGIRNPGHGYSPETNKVVAQGIGILKASKGSQAKARERREAARHAGVLREAEEAAARTLQEGTGVTQEHS